MEVGQKSFTQKKPDQLVYLELGASNGGMLLSISEDGFRFRAVTPLRPNLQMPFAFSLDGNQRLEGSGVIEDLEEDGKSGGIRFTELSDQFRASLRSWLGSQTSGALAAREVAPAVSTPLDTMEKIRRELRNGYRDSPRQPAAEPAVALPEPPSPAPEITLQKSAPAPSDKKPKPVVAEMTSEPHEIQLPSSLFSQRRPNQPQPAQFASVSSAFLKTRPVTESLQADSDAPPVVAIPDEPAIPAASRPRVPPLEDSFEQAWVQAKLNVPPDPPRLSRAAAGSIIAVALAVILGALGYNFRQSIGGSLIELGQAISGENHSSAAVPVQEPKPDQPSEAEKIPPQNSKESPAALQNAAEQKETAPISSGAALGEPSSKATTPDLSLAKPSQKPSLPPAVDSNVKSPVLQENGNGQQEFNMAQGILRGSNRKRDLPKAVDLLWAGVKKGYVPAEVTLGDLFRRGDGVEKNCDQATVLLTAASKKGSSDARKILEQLAEKGCE